MKKNKYCFTLSEKEKFRLEMISIERRKSMSRIIGEMITKLTRKRQGKENVI